MYENGWKVEPYRAIGARTAGTSNKFGLVERASWSQVDAELLGEFVQHITDARGWCSFAIPPDGGVLLVTVIYGDRKWTRAPRSADEAAESIRYLKDTFARNM